MAQRTASFSPVIGRGGSRLPFGLELSEEGAMTRTQTLCDSNQVVNQLHDSGIIFRFCAVECGHLSSVKPSQLGPNASCMAGVSANAPQRLRAEPSPHFPEVTLVSIN